MAIHTLDPHETSLPIIVDAVNQALERLQCFGSDGTPNSLLTVGGKKDSKTLNPNTLTSQQADIVHIGASSRYSHSTITTGANNAARGQSFVKTRGTDETVQTIVQSGDVLHKIDVGGSDGSQYQQAAQITVKAAGTPGLGAVPGSVNISTTNASGTLTPALTLDQNQSLILPGTTDATNLVTGALQLAGGASITKSLFVGGAINATNTTDAVNINTGSVIVSGGVGITKSLWVGSILNVAGAATFQSTGNFTGSLTAQAAINAIGLTDSTSTGTGEIICTGGVGIAKNLYLAGTGKLNFDTPGWTSFTFTFVPNSGTVTNTSASAYFRIGNIVFCRINEICTVTSGAPTSMQMTLPFACKANAAVLGVEAGLSTKACYMRIDGGLTLTEALRDYTGAAFVPTTNQVFQFSICYECQ